MAKLTDKAVENEKPGPKRKEVPDAAMPGLYLLVQPSGAKSWAYRFRFGGKTRKLTLGRYPKVGLAGARKLFQERPSLKSAKARTRHKPKWRHNAKRQPWKSFAGTLSRSTPRSTPGRDHCMRWRASSDLNSMTAANCVLRSREAKSYPNGKTVTFRTSPMKMSSS